MKTKTKNELFNPMSPKEVARRKKAARSNKVALLKRFRKAISKNMKVPLLTRAQVLKWYNMSPDWLDQMPVAMFVGGEPRYIEYQLDREVVRVMDGTVVTVDHESGQMVAITKLNKKTDSKKKGR